MSLSTQDILDSMDARRPKVEKIAALYSDPNSAVHKLANMTRWWNTSPESYDAKSLDKTFARSLETQIQRTKKSAERLS